MAEKPRTPEEEFQQVKAGAMEAPLPAEQRLEAAMKQVEIEDAIREGDKDAANKLQGEVLKMYLDNYDKTVAPHDPKIKEENARTERLKAAEIEEFRREHGRVFPEYRGKSSYRAKSEFLDSDAFLNAPDKRKALKLWEETYWADPGNQEKDKEEHAAIQNELREKERVAQEQREVAQAAEQERKRKRFFGLGRFLP